MKRGRGRPPNSSATAAEAATTPTSSAAPSPALQPATATMNHTSPHVGALTPTASPSHLPPSSSAASSTPSIAFFSLTHTPSGEPLNAPHDPLVGPEYQADVPEFVPPPPLTTGTSKSGDPINPDDVTFLVKDGRRMTVREYFEGTALWNPHTKNMHNDKRKQEQLDKYIINVETLFAKDCRHSTQELALHFLHKCEYDIALANRLLKPWQPIAEDYDVDEEEMYPADPFCSVCRDGGNLMLCDHCEKSYHPACVQLESVPSGEWSCPYHSCATCKESVDPTAFQCAMCPTSYCSKHIPEGLLDRMSTLGCDEPHCEMCLAREEEYDAVQKLKAASAKSVVPGLSCRRAFVHRLQMVLKREGRQLTRMPIIGNREFDLYALYNAVCKAGGIKKLVLQEGNKGWSQIRRALRLPSSVHHQCTLFKKFYFAILYPYEKQFYPGFQSVPLKKAMMIINKEADEEEEEEEEVLDPTPSPKEKEKEKDRGAEKGSGGGKRMGKKAQAALAAANAAAAQLAATEHASMAIAWQLFPRDPNQKDDTKPEDVIINLKVGGVAGHGASMSKGKESAAAARKKKQREKEKEKRRQLAREAKLAEAAALAAANKRGGKAAAAKAAAAAAALKGGAKGAKRGRKSAADLAAAAAAAAVSHPSKGMTTAEALSAQGVTAPMKDHAAINIWTQTWWAHRAHQGVGKKEEEEEEKESSSSEDEDDDEDDKDDISEAAGTPLMKGSAMEVDGEEESSSEDEESSSSEDASEEEEEEEEEEEDGSAANTPAMIPTAIPAAAATAASATATPIVAIPGAAAAAGPAAKNKRKLQEMTTSPAPAAALASAAPSSVTITTSVTTTTTTTTTVAPPAPAAVAVAPSPALTSVTPPVKPQRGRPPKNRAPAAAAAAAVASPAAVGTEPASPAEPTNKRRKANPQ